MENWIITELHIHSQPNGHVRWDHYDAVYLVDNWIEQPYGRTQLHFPKTRWIRDVPDPELEDLDGDIEMLDAAQEGAPATVESLVEALSRVRLG